MKGVMQKNNRLLHAGGHERTNYYAKDKKI